MVNTSEATGTGEPAARRGPRETFLATLSATVVVVVGYWLLIPRAGYHDIVYALQFAGSPERLADRVMDTNLRISVTDARWAMVSAIAFSILWGACGWALLRNYWASAWKAGVGRSTSGAALGILLGLVAAAIGVLEKGLTLVSLRTEGDAVRFVEVWGSVVPKTVVTLAWIKWVLAGIMITVVVAMLVSTATAAVRRKLPAADPELPPDEPPPLPTAGAPGGVGICCSGGGIRAAGFALGALARLEQEPDDAPSEGKLGVLGRAKYLASVSGGGYAAAGWRIAAGTGRLPDQPILGDPLDPTLNQRIRAYPKPNEPASDLIQHIRERRRYLSNGPGGLLRSAVIVVGYMTFHFALLLLFVGVVAWPLGRIVVSWAITGDGRGPDVMSSGLNTDIGIHQWLPPLVVAAVAALLCLWRLGLDRTDTRRKIDYGIQGALGMAMALFLLLIALPYAIDWLIGALPEGGGRRIVVAGVYGMVVAVVWQVAKTRLQAMARYLGGLLLAAGLTVFALFIMAQAADTDELFSSFYVWAAGLIALAAAFILFNPDRWSLHGFYRVRLAGTFAAKRQDGGGLVPHTDEPTLADYRAAEGPQPVICCSAARKESLQTGVPVLSMTFEPSGIRVYRWSGAESSANVEPDVISHAEFQRRLPTNQHGQHLKTAMGAAAISGAAVAPSLGRKSMKGTDALLAAFNARLGVWVPNPGQQTYENSTTPRLVNMFKEIIKTYDPADPNVYATDGGHWENLGLVELIRRRCAVIICIDASGDSPGSYTALKEAIKLASLECGAEVEMAWEPLELSADGVAKKNFTTGRVQYANDETGECHSATVLYVKAAIMESTPLNIQRYAAGDARFPNYSTADQMLNAEELSHLIHLGYASMDDAMKENPEVITTAMAEVAEPAMTSTA